MLLYFILSDDKLTSFENATEESFVKVITSKSSTRAVRSMAKKKKNTYPFREYKDLCQGLIFFLSYAIIEFEQRRRSHGYIS